MSVRTAVKTLEYFLPSGYGFEHPDDPNYSQLKDLREAVILLREHAANWERLLKLPEGMALAHLSPNGYDPECWGVLKQQEVIRTVIIDKNPNQVVETVGQEWHHWHIGETPEKALIKEIRKQRYDKVIDTMKTELFQPFEEALGIGDS